jgi:hypothetical protein
MARSKLSGKMLQDNLQRDNDLSIQGGLLHFDVGNNRVGINTVTPRTEFEVFGSISVGNIKITESGIESSGNISIAPTGNVDVSGFNINNLAEPVANSDAATRQFVANSITDATFDITDGSNTDTIDAGDTIAIQGTTNQTKSTLSGSTFTVGLTDDVSIVGNLTVNDKLFVDGIDIGNNISGGGNLTIPGEVVGDSFVANTALTLPYLNDNALVFTDGDDTLITYAGIRYDGIGSINIDNVAVAIDNIEITGNSLSSTDDLNLTAATGNSVTIANLKVVNNDTPTLIYFVDSQGHATTDSNLSFANSTLTIQGNVTANKADIDNVSIDGNRISSDSNLVFSAASNSFVTVDNTTGIIVPVGTVAERPANAEAGTVRYNSDTNILEVYNGVEWEGLGTDVTFITSQIIQGDDSTTVFTLNQEATTAGILVYINGVAQTPGVSYTVSGDQLTFVEAPQSSDTVEIRFISLSQTVSALTDETGETAVRVTNNDEIKLIIAGTEVGSISNSAIDFSSDTPISSGSQRVGFLESPQRIVTGNTTLSDSDRGGHLYINSTGTFDITIPENSTVPLPTGTQVAVISHSTSDVTLTPAANVDLYLAGNSVSSTRTIGSYGRADLIKVADNVWSLSGFSIT